MRKENELTNHVIQFAIHGWSIPTPDWLILTCACFAEHGFPLKSAEYLINPTGHYSSSHRKSLKTFYKQPMPDNFELFNAFSGVSQKYPDTWYYGCYFDERYQHVALYFDTSFPEADILKFYKNYLVATLAENTAWTGYLFDCPWQNLYAVGGAHYPQYDIHYKEARV